ncbi:MAG TPA: sulfurtransferase [Frankiaceae bacterium]|nr:sulfurtransferase [Frankiaceae bacterium]
MIPPVIDTAWLQEHGKWVVLADVRWYLDGRSGLDAYAAGHLPGAVFVDLDRWLAAPAEPTLGRHPLPTPEVFAEGMALLGIADDDVVVAYDDQGGVIAARLVWMLRSTGHEAALLDGGIDAYAGPLETVVPVRERAEFSVRPWPDDRLASIDEASGPGEASNAADSGNSVGAAAPVVLDARDADRYRGDVEPVDPRAGHIPGALNLPCRENLDETGRFLAIESLRERFAAAGVDRSTDVISYCGSGVTACHNLIALEHAGFGIGRLYPGSWSQYSSTDEREAAVCDAPA